jgi:hypothetical protein
METLLNAEKWLIPMEFPNGFWSFFHLGIGSATPTEPSYAFFWWRPEV